MQCSLKSQHLIKRFQITSLGIVRPLCVCLMKYEVGNDVTYSTVTQGNIGTAFHSFSRLAIMAEVTTDSSSGNDSDIIRPIIPRMLSAPVHR